MYLVGLSESAERAVASFTSAEGAEFQTIEDQLARNLPALLRQGLVQPLRFFSIDGYRYYDNRFPFLIFFEIGQPEQGYGVEVLLIDLILDAPTDFPTQLRV